MNGRFPKLALPIAPPLRLAEPRLVEALPSVPGLQYEPMWDGLRCLAFRDGRTVVLQSRGGEPLTRYFPELVMALGALPQERYVLDGEVVIFGSEGRLAYEELGLRIHPSARKVAQLSARSPATLLVSDLLAEDDTSLLSQSVPERRRRLVSFFERLADDGTERRPERRSGGEQISIRLSPATTRLKEAESWMRELEGVGLDGIVARPSDEKEPAQRFRIAHTAGCVIGGFRRDDEGEVSSLLLGLYDDEGLLHFVGLTERLPPAERAPLSKLLSPLVAAPPFTGRAPGVETRSGATSHAARPPRDWEGVQPVLVCRVRYDHYDRARFRRPARYLSVDAQPAPTSCTLDGLRSPERADATQKFPTGTLSRRPPSRRQPTSGA